LPKIPLIEDLTKDSVPPGTNILVEFDPDSQWYNASVTIAAGWMKTGGGVSYNVFAQPPDSIRAQFKRLGLNSEELEKTEQLRIFDWYTASLGQKSKERFANDSLKVADLSIEFSKGVLAGPPITGRLRISDNVSVLARFNDEKTWIEFGLTRGFPAARVRKSTAITGMMAGTHSEWAYKQNESAVDGIVDFKLEDASNGETIDVIRIRNMRNTNFTKGWHRLKIGENFEVTLDK